MSEAKEDVRLTRVAGLCLSLPETTREVKHSHPVFVVNKKSFAYFLNDNHGDGIVSIACKALPGDNRLIAAADPQRFYLPAYLGADGWIALRLDLTPPSAIDWEEVLELITGSYVQAAPKRLVAMVMKLQGT